MSLLPFIGEDSIVGHHRLFNPVCCCQDLLTLLFGICFNLTDLSPMGIPLPFHIINLERNVSRAIKRPYVCFSHPGFKLHNLG